MKNMNDIEKSLYDLGYINVYNSTENGTIQCSVYTENRSLYTEGDYPVVYIEHTKDGYIRYICFKDCVPVHYSIESGVPCRTSGWTYGISDYKSGDISDVEKSLADIFDGVPNMGHAGNLVYDKFSYLWNKMFTKNMCFADVLKVIRSLCDDYTYIRMTRNGSWEYQGRSCGFWQDYSYIGSDERFLLTYLPEWNEFVIESAGE